MTVKKIILFLFVLVFLNEVYAQTSTPPFYADIQAFKKQDSINPPPAHPILFVGSSSFTKWTNVQEMFPGYTIVNRGFGGSSLPDVIRYADDVIFKYNPKEVVIYCGENDVAASDTIDSKIVSERFKTLVRLIRSKLPVTVPIVYISMKPSPSREKFRKTMVQTNQIIKNYFYTLQNVLYVDVFSKMLDAEGNPKKEIFLADNLHMNQEGYKIWQAVLQPYLMKN